MVGSDKYRPKQSLEAEHFVRGKVGHHGPSLFVQIP
jgi:hypothetical protein